MFCVSQGKGLPTLLPTGANQKVRAQALADLQPHQERKQMQKEHTQLESIKGDLAVASEIQQAILPRIFPPFPENVESLEKTIYSRFCNSVKDYRGNLK